MESCQVDVFQGLWQKHLCPKDNQSIEEGKVQHEDILDPKKSHLASREYRS